MMRIEATKLGKLLYQDPEIAIWAFLVDDFSTHWFLEGMAQLEPNCFVELVHVYIRNGDYAAGSAGVKEAQFDMATVRFMIALTTLAFDNYKKIKPDPS